VTQLAIAVLNKSNSRRAVGIVLDAHHFGRHPVFTAFEINLAIMLFVTAPDVTRSQSAVVVPAPGFPLRLEQTPLRTPFRDFIKSRRLLETLDWGERAIILKRHKITPARSSRLPRGSRLLFSNARADQEVRELASVFRRNCRCSHRPLSFGTNAAP